jgi:hypothetical protein
MSWILRIRLARRWGIHVHLRVARHSHVRAVGRLVGHHMSTHWRPLRRDELAGLAITHSDMLHIRTHSVLWHLNLLWVTRHRLWLGAIHVRMHGSGGGVNRRLRMRELHMLGFEVRRSLTRMRLNWRTAWSMLRRLPLRENLSTLKMRGELVLMRHRTVAHCIVRRGKWR